MTNSWIPHCKVNLLNSKIFKTIGTQFEILNDTDMNICVSMNKQSVNGTNKHRNDGFH